MAAEILIPHKELVNFTQKRNFSIFSINEFAKNIGVNAGIVIGRLQNDKYLSPSQLNQYKVKFEEC